jgi:hypothetical protein
LAPILFVWEPIIVGLKPLKQENKKNLETNEPPFSFYWPLISFPSLLFGGKKWPLKGKGGGGYLLGELLWGYGCVLFYFRGQIKETQLPNQYFPKR